MLAPLPARLKRHPRVCPVFLRSSHSRIYGVRLFQATSEFGGRGSFALPRRVFRCAFGRAQKRPRSSEPRKVGYFISALYSSLPRFRRTSRLHVTRSRDNIPQRARSLSGGISRRCVIFLPSPLFFRLPVSVYRASHTAQKTRRHKPGSRLPRPSAATSLATMFVVELDESLPPSLFSSLPPPPLLLLSSSILLATSHRLRLLSLSNLLARRPPPVVGLSEVTACTRPLPGAPRSPASSALSARRKIRHRNPRRPPLRRRSMTNGGGDMCERDRFSSSHEKPVKWFRSLDDPALSRSRPGSGASSK